LLATDQLLVSRRLPSPPDVEVILVEFCTCPPVLVCATYLPPNQSAAYHTKLLHFLNSLSSHNNLIILGDFNSPDINWSSLTANSPFSKSFCDFVFHHDLEQHINFPTHNGGNILDIVLSKHSVSVFNVCLHSQNCPVSDHFPISFTVPMSIKHFVHPTSNLPTMFYDFSKADYSSICSFLLEYDFSQLYQSTNIESIWALLKEAIYQSISLFTPFVKQKSKVHPKWFSSDIRHQLNKIHSIRKQCKRNPSPANFSKLSSSESHLQSSILEARSDYESALVESFARSRAYKIYKYIKHFTSKSDLPTTISYNSTIVTSAIDKANAFNAFFHSVFNHSSKEAEFTNLSFPINSICSISISTSDTFTALTSLDTTKAMGCDGIPPSLFVHCAIALLEPIHHLFTLCLSQHYLPLEWRSHHIVPIPKSKDTSTVANFRPISLLCCISKVLERLVFDKIFDFLANHCITLSQFGFMKRRSTLKQLLLFTEFLNSSYDNHQQVDTVYLDIRKAFDSIPHDKLLTKLWESGITGSLWGFCKAYLTDRRQRVVIEGQHSSWLPVSSGVPQGSILGPLFFIVYVNELPSVLTSALAFMFADDTKCSKRILSSTDCSLLQSDLNNINDWSCENDLQFNVSKFKLLRFYNRSNIHFSENYSMDGVPIEECDYCRDLGVIISVDLSWSQHYDHMIRAAYQILGLIRRTFSSSASTHSKKLLYLSLIRSRLIYCSQVWKPHLIKDIKLLELVQRRATKFILNDYTSSYKTRLISLQLLPLMYMYELFDILFMVNCLLKPDPSFPVTDFISFSTAHTRSGYSVKLKHKTSESNHSYHSYLHRIIRLWNAVPTIDLTLSVITIRKHLLDFFWQHFTDNFDSNNPCTLHFMCPCNSCSKLPRPCNFL
jgi:hypothetical protein